MFISWIHCLGFMGKALEVVNKFYDLTNNKNTTKGLEELLAQEIEELKAK
jgi:hypothetical protein